MALANVAFIAAFHGLRVLVMDWDLEAPGLPYYFRGMLDPTEGRHLKDAPGLLNLFWRWRRLMDGNSQASLTDAEKFTSGSVFEESVRSLVSPDAIPTGRLDYLSAGSRVIQEVDSDSYEDALANFSWLDFFSKHGGGVVIEALRNWSKRNYDLVLIDSRTGLADVAGVCTMQLPDSVILCFVLNRQNIDGIARASAAIRQKRLDTINLHAVPMRTAIRESSEESDARARAIAELTRVGGFSSDQLSDDFRHAIRLSDSMPYYETLAPLLSQDPGLDVLTNHFVRLASLVTQREMKPPRLDPDWVDIVKQRLQPRHATTEYVASLSEGSPDRAVEELSRLLRSAYEDEMDGGYLDSSYVRALVEAAFNAIENPELDSFEDDVAARSVDLLRTLATEQGDEWKPLLLSTLERYWTNAGYMLDTEQQIAVLDEIDELLSAENSISQRLRRIEFRRAAARVLASEDQPEPSLYVVVQVQQLIEDLKADAKSLSQEQQDALLLGEVELNRIRGDVFASQKKPQKAIREFSTGLDRLDGRVAEGKPAFVRSAFVLNLRLCHVETEIELFSSAIDHALRATSFFQVLRLPVGPNFVGLSEPIVRSQNSEAAVRLCKNLFLPESGPAVTQLSSHWARTPKFAAEFIGRSADLISLMADESGDSVEDLAVILIDVTRNTLSSLARRRFPVSTNYMKELDDSVELFRLALSKFKLEAQAASEIDDALSALRSRRRTSFTRSAE